MLERPRDRTDLRIHEGSHPVPPTRAERAGTAGPRSLRQMCRQLQRFEIPGEFLARGALADNPSHRNVRDV